MKRPFAALFAALLLAGCASLPRERGYAETGALLQQRIGVAPADGWSSPERPEIPTGELALDQVVALAFVHNPQVRLEYARIGLARAELERARRLANPGFSFSRLRGDGAHPQVSRSLSLGFTDLLLQPARRRWSSDELERVQQSIAARLLDLATEVESAWHAAVAARQVAQMRRLVLDAAEASAELAGRFHDAGNISLLQLERERAQQAQARIDAARATAAWLRARSQLAEVAGLPAGAAWSVPARLPAPPDTRYASVTLMPYALQNRLDLAAAAREVGLHEDALGITRRWRWLGEIEVGFERERESDGGIARGPTLGLQLPIFSQGQAALERAMAELEQARARADALRLAVANEVRLAVQQLNLAREIANEFRGALLPARESIVQRTRERQNYMLVGVFELIQTRREQFDAYQSYLEAVRDYWLAHARLRRAVGGRLPDDPPVPEPTLGVDAILAPASDDTHAGHGSDPHAAHRHESQAQPAPAHGQHDHHHGDQP